MRFERIVATAFGAMRGQQLKLDAAMTVIHGPNEAGKSTWFAALYAGLAGRKRGASKAPQKEFRRRHKPWIGSAWRVELTLALDSGRRLQLDQNLADPSVTVKDAATGGYLNVAALEREVGISLVNDGAFDGSRLLGLDRDAVRSTFFVGQADMLAVLGNANELQQHLQRAASTTSVDTTAEEALHRIKDMRSTRVGSPHIGNKPLRATSAAALEAAAEVDSALDLRHRLLVEQAKLKASVASAGRAASMLAELETLAEWVEIDRLLARAREARELRRNLTEATSAGVPADEEAIRVATGVVERYLKRGEPPVEPTGTSAAELRAEIDELPAMPDGPREPEPDVVKLEEHLAAAGTSLKTVGAEAISGPAAVAIDVSPDELRTIADRLEADAPVLREGVEARTADLKSDLERRRTDHARRLAVYESAAANYGQAQTAYSQQLSEYEAASQRFKAQDAQYNAEVEAERRAIEQMNAARAEHVRATNAAQQALAAAKRRRLGGFAMIALGAVLSVAAAVTGFQGIVPVAVGFGVVAAVVVIAAAAMAARRLPESDAPAFQERSRPVMRVRPTPPAPPRAPAPLGLVHPGDVPPPSGELLECEHERGEWQSLFRLHAESVAAARERANTLGVNTSPAELRTLARSIDDHEDAKVRYSQHMTRLHDAEEIQRNCANALLRRLGQPVPGYSLDEPVMRALNAVRDYRLECRARDEQAKKAERKTDLEGVLEQRVQRDAAYSSALKNFDSAAVDLVGAATNLQLNAASDNEALEALDEWLHDQRRLADLQAGANLEIGKLEQLLDGATIEEIEAEADARSQAAPSRPVQIDSDQLAELDIARQDKSRADGDVQESQRAIKDLTQVSKPVAAAIERETRLSNELANLKELDHCLELADTHLKVAKERAHADIAPALADTMRPWVPRVTSGRYVDITVDPETLKLQAFDAQGRSADADVLSQGTTEQFFLLLRIALAIHLSRVDETVPLVLDDVTVQADPERTRAILELLHELSAEHQVVLFTQEPEVIQWATENLAADAVIGLV